MKGNSMAGKRLPKNVDFAAGFFSTSSSAADIEQITTPDSVPAEPEPLTKKPKNPGGRPKKEGLKNEQFSLTMHPETYEKLKIVADTLTRGNFSALMDEAIKLYCHENGIDLNTIEVDPEILEIYHKRQEKKSKKKS